MNRKAIFAYSVGAVLCLLILVWAMKLWEADLTVPFAYEGDALPNYVWVKGIIDNGWYLHNSFVGMPTGLYMHDFPQTHNLDFLLSKLISVFTQDYASTVNIYFLLTFLLATLTSIFVLRQFNLSYPSAVFGSLLFAFSPFHFLRFVHHLQYSSYFVIPLIVMVILWIRSENSILFSHKRDSVKSTFNLFSRKSIISIIVCVLISSVVVYYAFFSVFFLLIVGLLSAFQQKSWRPLVTTVFFVGVIVVGVVINLLPTLSYQHDHGRNIEVALRGSAEAEIFGLKITHLFLPVLGHRIPFLADLTTRYESVAPLINENMLTSLGFIGSIGFIALVVWFLYSGFAGLKVKDNLELNTLSVLNLSAVLLATIGGFGSIFAFLVSPQIRAYNRISIFIAFFSLFAVAILLNKFSKKCARFKITRLLFNGLIGFILFIGLLDQIPKEAHVRNYASIKGYSAIKTEYLNDANFIKSIEGFMPKGSMIFQLPYVPFPENPTVNRMLDYDLFRPYLHSKSLRWSYGAMKGREANAWQREVAAKPLEEMVEVLAFAGFNGIYLDRFGYADSGKEVEDKLSQLLKTAPIVSNNKRLVFFNMTLFNEMLKEAYTIEEWEIKRRETFPPLFLEWKDGFSALERTTEDNWRWCSSKGKLWITNPWSQSREVTLEMFFKTDYEEFSDLLIDGPSFSEKLQINKAGKSFSKTITIPQGRYSIQFESNAKRVNAPWDSRVLVFKVINFRLKGI